LKKLSEYIDENWYGGKKTSLISRLIGDSGYTTKSQVKTLWEKSQSLQEIIAQQKHDHGVLFDKASELEERLDKCREWAKLAWHYNSCDKMMQGELYDCTCGLDELLKDIDA